MRAQQAGLSATWVPIVMVVMALFYTLSAYPVGKLSDRVSRTSLLRVGLMLLILSDLVLASAESVSMLILGVVLWGLHMGFNQGLLAALVADTTPAELKGTAFRIFNLVSGVSMLLASGIAGLLWQTYGSAMTFYASAVFSAIAPILLIAQRSKSTHRLHDHGQ